MNDDFQRVGFDTGFFKQLLEKHPTAVSVWEHVQAREVEAITACIVLFEFRRLSLRGTVPKRAAEILIEHIPLSCRVVWLGNENAPLLDRAARIAHGNGLSMADALILVSLMDAGAEVVYTTDHDFEKYTAGPDIHVLSSS